MKKYVFLRSACAATALLVTSHVFAQHLYYNDPGSGDIMALDIKVDATASKTYYETLGWNNSADGGGYTGIQSTPNGPTFIFSIWDPLNAPGQPITAVYQKPGSKTEPFGGEGTGLHYLDTTLGWSVGTPVKMIVRTWPYKGHTYFGMWSFDQGTGVWTHHTTFDFPEAGMNFNSYANSFLENYAGEDLQSTRLAYYYNGWKRTAAGQWYPFTRAVADQDKEFGVSHNRFFLQTGTPAPSVPSPIYVTASGDRPAIPPTQIQNPSATYDATSNSVSMSWQTSSNSGPQFSYTVSLVSASSGAVVASSTDIAPEARTASLPVPQGSAIGQLAAQLTVQNVIDTPTTVPSMPISTPPALSVGTAYTLSSLQSGLVLAVPGNATQAATVLTQEKPNGSAAQQWLLSASKIPGEYTLQATHTYQCMDVQNGNLSSGTPLIQYPCTGGGNESMTLAPNGNGAYVIRFHDSGLCADVTNGSFDAGAVIEQYACTAGKNQTWTFTPVGAAR
jgi:hypothetical protein